MMKIKYHGIRKKGTANPRRIWTPGETLELQDDVAERLLQDPEFKPVKQKRSRTRKQTKKPGSKKTPEVPGEKKQEE